MNTKVLLLIGIVLVLFAATNPSIETHKAEVKQMLTQKMNLEEIATETAESEDTFEQVGNAIGTTLGLAFVDKMIDNAISTDSYVLFSLTKATWEGKEKVIGYGLLGNVFIFDEVKNADLGQ
ncbi:DUF4359 domain-containing protein [Rufibacter roseus]|uniref:DUF4359 domain-containing protein n=1 Tax=Rufibacter roseus TaxID=1567108 RepID=A0ABW2DN87_9BACT|nr:DUF4359 domain-containing protein [Rufibacter roseus]